METVGIEPTKGCARSWVPTVRPFRKVRPDWTGSMKGRDKSGKRLHVRLPADATAGELEALCERLARPEFGHRLARAIRPEPDVVWGSAVPRYRRTGSNGGRSGDQKRGGLPPFQIGGET